MYDCAIIGSGPAGLSAALNLKIHNKSFVWFGSKDFSAKLSKAEKISNFPGFTDVSGADLSAAFRAQMEAMGIQITEAMINQIIPNGNAYALMAGSEFYEAGSVILATGVVMKAVLPGEAEYLGRGVSYCATCDGGLYRGKTIAVLCSSARFEHEVRFLAELAAKVYYYPQYKEVGALPENVEVREGRISAVLGERRVNAVEDSRGEQLLVDGLFCLRDNISLDALLPGLDTEDGHIKTDRRMCTSMPGVFAAGDCTGRPYQYVKAAGEGNVAAHSAIEYLDEMESEDRL